jgi:hypothetical protein
LVTNAVFMGNIGILWSGYAIFVVSRAVFRVPCTAWVFRAVSMGTGAICIYCTVFVVSFSGVIADPMAGFFVYV